MGIDWSQLALPKGHKGQSYMEARTRRKAVKAAEDAAKEEVRKRDKSCRWPHCANCKAYKPRLEVAHLDAKGMGGDHGTVSGPDQMILLDFLTHQSGPRSLEQHGKRIDPITAQGTNGPCEFWAKDENEQWYLVAREVAPFLYERD
jgi:hypothetical protein